MRHRCRVYFCLSAFLFFAFVPSPLPLFADYTQELEGQIRALQNRYAQGLDLTYFHDMALIAKKADEAGLDELATTTVKSLLFEKMDQFIFDEMGKINEKFGAEPQGSFKKLSDLIQFKRQYQPEEDYLQTAMGAGLSAELGRFRKEVLEKIEQSCAEEDIIQGIQALQKTNLFVTHSPEEILSIQNLIRGLECCLSWKSQIHYRYAQDFATDYETGVFTQEAHLKLQTPPREPGESRWEGEWIYRLKGKEGSLQGVSRGTLRHRRGEDTADLVITTSRMSSTGRLNMPLPLAGDHKTLEVEGKPIEPQVILEGDINIPLTGCRENSISDQALPSIPS